MKIPSGAKLEVSLAPFDEGKALYQAVAEELKGLKIDAKEESWNFGKDLLCTFLASKRIEECLYKCMLRCRYNGLAIRNVSEIFEPEASRGDYLPVCWEVMVKNLAPFGKGLYAEYSPLLEKVKDLLASRPQTTPS